MCLQYLHHDGVVLYNQKPCWLSVSDWLCCLQACRIPIFMRANSPQSPGTRACSPSLCPSSACTSARCAPWCLAFPCCLLLACHTYPRTKLVSSPLCSVRSGHSSCPLTNAARWLAGESRCHRRWSQPECFVYSGYISSASLARSYTRQVKCAHLRAWGCTHTGTAPNTSAYNFCLATWKLSELTIQLLVGLLEFIKYII